MIARFSYYGGKKIDITGALNNTCADCNHVSSNKKRRGCLISGCFLEKNVKRQKWCLVNDIQEEVETNTINPQQSKENTMRISIQPSSAIRALTVYEMTDSRYIIFSRNNFYSSPNLVPADVAFDRTTTTNILGPNERSLQHLQQFMNQLKFRDTDTNQVIEFDVGE